MTTKPARTFGLLRSVFAAAIALPVIAGGAAFWLAGTESGRSAALSLAVRLVPGLTAESIEGPLGALRLRGIGWESPGVRVRLGTLAVGLDWRALLDRRVHLTELTLEDAEATVSTADIPPSEEPEEPSSGPVDLHLPVTVELDRLAVRRVHAAVDGANYALGEFSTSARLADGALSVPEANALALAANLPGTLVSAEGVALRGFVWNGAALDLELVDLGGGRVRLAAAGPEGARTAGTEKTASAKAEGKVEAAEAAEAAEPAAADGKAENAEKTDGKAGQGKKAEGTAVAGFAERIEAALREPLLKSLPEVTLPLDARVGRVRAAGWEIAGIAAEGTAGLSPLVVRTVEAEGLEARTDGTVALKSFRIDTSTGSASLSASLRMAGPWPLKAHLEAEADLAPWGRLAGLEFAEPRTSVRLDLAGEAVGRLTASGATKGAATLDFTASADASQPWLPFDVKFSAAELRVPKIIEAEAEGTSEGAAAQAAAAGTGAKSAKSAKAAKAPPQDAVQGEIDRAIAEAAKEAGIDERPQEAVAAAEAAKPSTTVDNAGRVVRAKGGKAAPKTGAAPEMTAGQLAVRSAYALRDLHLDASGDARNWTLALKGVPEVTAPKPVFAGRRTFTGTLEAKAGGSLARAGLERFLLETDLGRIELSGGARWKRDLDWDANFSARGLDLQKWLTTFPFRLEADMSGSGTIAPGGGFTLSTKADVKGRIGVENAPVGFRLAADGSDGTSWRIDDLHVLLGRNTLDLRGEVERLRSVSADLRVDAPGLLNTIPGLKGRAEGAVRIDGSLAHPKLTADLRAHGLAWNDAFRLDDLTVKGEILNSPNPEADVARLRIPAGAAGNPKSAPKMSPAREAPGAGTPPPKPAGAEPPGADATLEEKIAFIVDSLASGEVVGRLNVALDGLRAAGADVPKARIGLEGRETAHVLRIDVNGDPVSADVTVTGGFSRDSIVWEGSLSRAEIGTPAGVWRTASAAGIRFEGERARAVVDAHCWRHEDAEVCAPKPLVLGRAGEAELRLTRLNIAVLKPYLRKKSDTIEGRITGGLRAKWDMDRDRLPSGSVDLNGDGLAYSTRFQGVRFPVRLERLRAHALFGEKLVAFAWDVKPAGNGTIWGEAGVTDPLGRRGLKGHFGLTGVRPSFIEPFLSKNEKAEGVVNVGLTAGGTVAAPELYGRFAVEDVEVGADFIPVDMEPSSLAIDFRGTRSELSGEIRAKHKDGIQTVRLSGGADWSDLKAWKASVNVKTDGLHLMLPPSIRADARADVSASADANAVTVTGLVEIPKARIEVKDMPASAVSVSDDQVMLDSELRPMAEQTQALALRANVDVAVGDDVRVAAYGLNARLGGRLKVVMDRGRMVVLGDVRIPEGRFRAYGQDLLIQTGTILFSGPPANPTLRIEAIRNPESTQDDVRVGIRVTGTAEQPEVALFSTPSMSDEEALSYLLRGEGLGSSDGSSSQMMTSMLIGLGTSQGGGILSEIGDAVGLSDVGIDTTGTGDEQQVVVSAYVLPGLQVKYGVGIFDSLATLTLRYRLMPRLYLEAVSGVEQALDLLYRFEF